MCQAFRFDSYCSCCRAVFGGRHSTFQLKSQQEGCYSGCETDFGHLELIASCSIFVGVHGCLFKAIATKCLVTPISSVSHLQPIVLPSLTLKSANEIPVWIEEDLIYTGMHSAFEFDHSHSCCKGILGRQSAIAVEQFRYYK